MENLNNKVISDFLKKFENDIELKKKIIFSEQEQLEVIADVYVNYVKYFTDENPKPITAIKGKHPHYILDFPNTKIEDSHPYYGKILHGTWNKIQKT